MSTSMLKILSTTLLLVQNDKTTEITGFKCDKNNKTDKMRWKTGFFIRRLYYKINFLKKDAKMRDMANLTCPK